MDIFALKAVKYVLHVLIIGSQKYPVTKTYQLGENTVILI